MPTQINAHMLEVVRGCLSDDVMFSAVSALSSRCSKILQLYDNEMASYRNEKALREFTPLPTIFVFYSWLSVAVVH